MASDIHEVLMAIIECNCMMRNGKILGYSMSCVRSGWFSSVRVGLRSASAYYYLSDNEKRHGQL